jgi:hypothetical protein
MSRAILFKSNINLQGLLENMAPGIYFWSSSTKYLGRGHLGRPVEGTENIHEK